MGRQTGPSRQSSADLPAGLAAVVGPANVLQGEAAAPYLTEPRDLFHGRALCVVRPSSTEEVSAVLNLCSETNTKLVPQGGNTGLVGGQIPSERGDEIVLSLERMNRLREIDAASNTLTVEAGMTLAQARAEAEKVDRIFPLALPAAPSCTIGGNLATNAGGASAIAYGTARDLVLGLEAVLADGRILRDLSKLKKDNTGYDLKNLFIGSEGTLGVITAAVLKLYPKPRASATAFVGLKSPEHALRLLDLTLAQEDHDLKTFELIPRIALDFVLAHDTEVADPLPTSCAYNVLLELASQREGLNERLYAVLETARERGFIRDAAVAASADDRAAFWRIRQLIPEVQRFEGGSIKHDISVPVVDVPAFLEEVEHAVTERIPGARLVAFGHFGDGNIHCNVSQPIGGDKEAFLARWDEVNEIVYAIAAAHHGSISAEHGIGQLKRKLLPRVKDPVALDLMRTLKRTLDPKGILNPGKVL